MRKAEGESMKAGVFPAFVFLCYTLKLCVILKLYYSFNSTMEILLIEK